MKPRLLVTGASGFIGWNLCRHAIEDWKVHGLYHQHSLSIPGVDLHALDLGNHQALTEAFHHIRPDAVVHLAAISSPNLCEQRPTWSRQINIDASVALAGLCAKADIPLVFASSSQVYDGEHSPYRETSEARPVNEYGQQKLQAERLMREVFSQLTICRIPLSFGSVPEGASSFLQPMLEAFGAGKPQKLFVDEYRCMLGAHSAVRGFLLALQHPGELFLLAGDECISRYEFGQRVATVFGYDQSGLVATHQADVTMSAKRPRKLHLLNDRIKQHGFSPWSIEAELRAVKDAMAAES